MAQFYLLFIATILYAGYNLLIKVSGDQVPISAETTISLTIVLQLAALSTSIAFAGVLLIQGVDILKAPSRAYVCRAAPAVRGPAAPAETGRPKATPSGGFPDPAPRPAR